MKSERLTGWPRCVQKHDRVVFLAERVNTLQLFAERLAQDGSDHQIYLVSGNVSKKSDDVDEENILRALLGIDTPSYKVISKGEDVERYFREDSNKRAEGKASLFMTYQMAEGINLQSCDTLVGLGITSNITNLIQGLGRVDRIDSPFRRVHYYLVDVPTPAVASDEKATQRLEKFRALTARERVARAPSVSRDTEEIFRDTIDFLEERRSLRDKNYHDLLSSIRETIAPARYREIAALDIEGLWGAELAILPASRRMTILHLRGADGAGSGPGRRMAPPRLLMIDDDGQLDNNQISCARFLRQAYEETVARGLHRVAPQIDDLMSAIERLGEQVAHLKEWDLRPERTESLLISLSTFLAPALGLDARVANLDQELFGDIGLDGIEVLCETWARHLDPYWIRAKQAVRESIVQDRAAEYISLDEITQALEDDMLAAGALRERMLKSFQLVAASSPRIHAG